MPRYWVIFALVAVLAFGAFSNAFAQQLRHDLVKQRGRVLCGVSGTTPGFSFLEAGQTVGFDADFCRAVAAWMNVPVEFVNLTSANRIPAVVAGTVDVVFRTTTQTSSREDQVKFGPVTFYDGQRLLVRKAAGIKGLADLSGKTVCVHAGTTSERNITDQLRARNIRFNLLTFSEAAQAFQGLLAGRCDVFTTDASQLTAFRSTAPRPGDLEIVGETFGDEPLAPFYQNNDAKWGRVVDWTVWGVILAEELGITQADAKNPARVTEIKAANPQAKVLLEFAEGAVVRVLAAVGNYGEIYNRWFGPDAPTAITREGSRNELAIRGGALTSRPFR
jgi:general L-amino acid transport system substrate-binding protein